MFSLRIKLEVLMAHLGTNIIWLHEFFVKNPEDWPGHVVNLMFVEEYLVAFNLVFPSISLSFEINFADGQLMDHDLGVHVVVIITFILKFLFFFTNLIMLLDSSITED